MRQNKEEKHRHRGVPVYIRIYPPPPGLSIFLGGTSGNAMQCSSLLRQRSVHHFGTNRLNARNAFVPCPIQEFDLSIHPLAASSSGWHRSILSSRFHLQNSITPPHLPRHSTPLYSSPNSITPLPRYSMLPPLRAWGFSTMPSDRFSRGVSMSTPPPAAALSKANLSWWLSHSSSSSS